MPSRTNVTVYHAADFREMAWKNGKGRTLELAIEPDIDKAIARITAARPGIRISAGTRRLL